MEILPTIFINLATVYGLSVVGLYAFANGTRSWGWCASWPWRLLRSKL